MDKKFFNKTSNFFKKEGFYVILFVCLCIVATVAVVTSRITKSPVKPPVVQDEAKETKDTTRVAQEPTESYDNALEVKKNTTPSKSETANNNTSTKASSSTSTAVSKTVDIKFGKPVEGTLAQAFSEDPVWSDSTNSYRPVLGINIKADLGKQVVAALDGKVLEVGEGEYGNYVAIYHSQNGLTTVYANLDKDIKVAKNQSVKKGDVIGKVGNTSLRSGYESYGSHLHFEVIKGKDISKDENKVDPAKYVKYTVAK